VLRNWVDAGLVIGHLVRVSDAEIQASPAMVRDFTRSSPTHIGELLTEMLEMHIPSLLRYPSLLRGEPKPTYAGDAYGHTVASTSALIEQRAVRLVRKWARRWGVKRSLDVGCGQGGYTLALAEQVGAGGEFVGLDIHQGVIARANLLAQTRGLPQAEFRCESFEDYVPEANLDLVMLNNLLHYYSAEGREQLIAKAAASLQAGGHLLLVSPLYLAPSGRRFSVAFHSFLDAHENLHGLPRKADIVAIADRHGLALVQCKPIIREGSWYCLAFEKKQTM
jgi:SAM-dependent methyltransferase